MLAIVLVAVIVILIYIRFIKPQNYWKDRRVKYVPATPFFGFMLDSILQRVCFTDIIEKLYKSHEDAKYVGIYQFAVPILLIRDPELIKQIAIKDADIFQDHSGFSREDIDPLWSKNLFSAKGEIWRELRATLSPSFTSSKMKAMFTLISDCAEDFMKYLNEQNKDIITVELKDLFTRFTNDVIATCAFGVTCDSQRDRENEFYLKGVEATDFSGLKGLKIFGFFVSPALMKLFKIKIFSTSTGNFFKKIIKDSINVRQQKGIIRPDMIQLLLEARQKHGESKFGEEDITAQALIFFLAGFDTASTLMVFICYELAANVEIQERLRQEVDDIYDECGGKITYEALHKMKYLDMVTLETLRKWPPTVVTDRVCNKDYKIPAVTPDEKDLLVEKDTIAWIPTYAIHRDPKHYTDPEKFDPERFNEENKDKINPATYLSFGIGPRACIGSRFALMENKLIIFHILSNFEIVPVKKSVIPVVLSKKHFNVTAEGGMWLGLKRRPK